MVSSSKRKRNKILYYFNRKEGRREIWVLGMMWQVVFYLHEMAVGH
jgi:hypothetical protein